MLSLVLFVLQSTTLSNPWQAATDEFVANEKFNGATIGIQVRTLDGRVLAEHGAKRRMIPASNQKLIASSFALYQLGPAFVPVTSIFDLKGKLVIVSNGDPSLTYEKLLSAQKAIGHRKKVILKQAYRVGVPAGWEFDDLPNRYAAQITAFSFDQGAFTLWSKNGKPELRPRNFGVKIDYKSSKEKWESNYDPFTRKVTITGQLPSAETRIDTLVLPNPDENAASIFGKLDLNNGSGFIIPPEAKPKFVISGDSLSDIVKRCLQNSDNAMAENLLLMGALKDGPIVDSPYRKARESTSKFLTETVGIARNEFNVMDGSGLARQNIVTANALATLLEWAHKQRTQENWTSSLAVPGKGTLGRRLIGTAFAGKTGTLTMVVALSGYLTTDSGEKVVVSCLLNHFACSSTEARDLVDRFMVRLSKLQVEFEPTKGEIYWKTAA